MPPIHSIIAALAALAGVGHTSPPHAAKHVKSRPTESITFALPAHHRKPLVAFAYVRGHAVKLSRPKVHGRHAVSQLTARALAKAGIKHTTSRTGAIALLFAHGHKVAQTRFTVPAFGQSSTNRHPKKRARAPRHAKPRPTESITFTLPAHHRDPLVAVAYIRGHAVKLSRPKVHGRHAVSQLTAGELVKARIKHTAARTRATARLFAQGQKIAETQFTVPAFRQSTTGHPKKRAGNGASASPSAPVSTGTGTGAATPVVTPLPQPASSSTPAPLLWAPPVLSNPTTINIKSGDPDVVDLSTSKDYILKMPTTVDTGTIEINGGHNVVLIGGQITVPSTANQTDNGADNTDTAIYIKGSTGTVQIEGMLINGQTNTMFDGIDINAPQATVQVENVRITGLLGSHSSEHADAIQTWGGVKVLRVDDFTAQSDYQGLTLEPDIGSVGSGQLQNVNLTDEPWPAALASKSSGGGVMLWLTGNNCTASPMSFSNVYIDNETDRVPSGQTIWPTTTSTLSCRAKQTGNVVTWPGLPGISGSVTLTAPPAGDFVPAGTVGVGYASPGYAAP